MPAATKRFDRRPHDRSVLIAEHSVLAGMRIEAGDGDARPGDAEAAREGRASTILPVADDQFGASVAAGTSASGMWMVTGTTRSSGAASIITGVAGLPKSSSLSAPRNSVWPGNANPASFSAFFWIGLVTIADASPRADELRGAADRADHGGRVGRVDPSRSADDRRLAFEARKRFGERLNCPIGARSRSFGISRPRAAARRARTSGVADEDEGRDRRFAARAAKLRWRCPGRSPPARRGSGQAAASAPRRSPIFDDGVGAEVAKVASREKLAALGGNLLARLDRRFGLPGDGVLCADRDDLDALRRPFQAP